MRAFLGAFVSVVSLCALSLHAAPITLGSNAIINGDAEAGTGSNDGTVVPVPDWTTVLGNFTAVQYGASDGFPTSSDPGPVNRGANFFAGGPGSPLTTATQLLDVSNISLLIDSGSVNFQLSGFFGGFSTQGDFASLTAQFIDTNSVPLTSAGVSGGTPAARGNQTGLLGPFSTSGIIPAGTRSILFQLDMTRLSGVYNDGYADNLSFVASTSTNPDPDPNPIPEPSTWALLAIGILLILVNRARTRFRVK